MRAINKLDIEIGNNDIPISLFSAIERETHLKQFSKCCNGRVTYKKCCSECDKELEKEDIYKGIAVGDEIKSVDEENVKSENGNLRILGVVSDDNEEGGIFKNGSVYFIGFQKDKSKRKTERNNLKFSYLKEALKESKMSLVGIVSLRGKEKIVLLKPYFNSLIGVGIYHFDRIRDIKDITGYSDVVETDKSTISQMSEKLKQKEKVRIKDIENKKEKLLEKELESDEVKTEKQKQEVNPTALIEF